MMGKDDTEDWRTARIKVLQGCRVWSRLGLDRMRQGPVSTVNPRSPMQLMPDELPAVAESNLRTYVTKLRRGFGSEGHRLATTQGGYRLTVRPGEFDLDMFTERVGHGRVQPQCFAEVTSRLRIVTGRERQGCAVHR